MARIRADIFRNCALAAGLFAGASVLVPPFQAQNPPSSSTRVSTSPEAAWITVDGQRILGAQTFNWPVNSKHTLFADPVQDQIKLGVRYTFRQWRAGTVPLPEGNPVTVSADPAIPLFQADFNMEYAVTVILADCLPDSPCQSPGTVYIGGTAVKSTTKLWVAAGGNVTIQAIPNPGYVFAGWAYTDGQVIQGFLNNIAIKQPMTITPVFQASRSVRLETEPAQLDVSADRSLTTTPRSFDWGRGSVHTLAPVTPQRDRQGAWWVFDSWSNGGPAIQAYKVADVSYEDVVTARYAPGVQVAISTVPAGLRLKIDGRDAAPPYSFIWTAGERHGVEAAERQSDAQGRTWVFDGWSNGQPSVHNIVMPTADLSLGYRLEARYRQLGRVTVTSNFGVKATIDGVECATPCTVERELGEAVRVSVPASLPLSDESRADFEGWSGGSTGAISVTAGSEPRTVAAVYRTMNRLRVSIEPSEAATCRIVPDSPDGFYDSSAVVSVSASPRPGFRLSRWEGDLVGSAPGGAVLMSAPRSARAAFIPVPYIPPSGVRNAAGDSGEAVAPGSVIAINGAHLAGGETTGPASPLAQALGDTTVRVGDRLLPLFFVSPERITAQLPADMSEGEAALAVRWANQPEVRATFVVARNAPGLFRNLVGERSEGLATHADGSSVSAESPLRAGEAVVLLGSGFGPSDPPRPLGFAIPDAPSFRLLDPITITIGDRQVQAEAAYAQPGRAGVDAVVFRVPSGLPSGAAPVSVESGGRTSNIVHLPVE